MKHPLSTILFDLDGTLLDNNMDVFVPPYFQLLSGRFSHLLPAKFFLDQLMRATNIMLDNDGRSTNQEVFAQAFYPAVGFPEEELEPIFLDFYANDFPQLQRYTRCKPEARAVIQSAFDRGCTVVIATNPLFPAIAIEQRLKWAGVDGFPYHLVTTYENSRACKPNLLYFQHILEALGQRAETCLVVGDEDADMVSAHLGCATFLIPSPRTNLGPDTPAPNYRGSLAEVRTLLDSL